MSESTLPEDTVDVADTAEPVVARHSIRQNVVHMMSSQLITWILATAGAMIIPRFLGPSTLGDLRLATALWLIGGAVAALGTTGFLQIEVARHQREGLELVGPILVIRTITFAACAVGVATYVYFTSDSHQFEVIVAILGIGTLISLWAETFGTAFLGLERMSTAAFANALVKLANFVGVAALLVAGAGVIGVVGVGLVTSIGGLAYIAIRYRKVASVTYEAWRRKARFILTASSTFMAAGIALILYQQIDLIVISWVAQSRDLGWYGASDTLFGSLLFPSTIIMGAIFPTLGRLYKTNKDDMEALVFRTFSLLAVLAVPMGLGTTLVAPDFAPLLYGEDFRQTGVVLAILGPVIVLTFGTILFGSTALATERGMFWVFVLLGAAALTVPLDIILVPWAHGRFDNGAIGGAMSYCVTEALQFVIGLIFIVPYLATRTVAWRTVRIIAAGGVMFAVGWPLRHMMLLVPIVVCAIVYTIAIIVFRVLGNEEKRMAGNLLARFGVHTRWAG